MNDSFVTANESPAIASNELIENWELRIENWELRTDAAEREQRVLAHFAEPQGGKACIAGLIENWELTPNSYLLTTH